MPAVETRGATLALRLGCSGGYAALAAASFVILVLFRPGQAIDAAALGATILSQPLEWQLAVFGALRWWSIPVLALAALLLGCFALGRGRWRTVLAALVCTAATVMASELLKGALERPDLGIGSYQHNSWPSGHAAAVAALALACQRLCSPEWPGRRRQAIAWLLVGVVTLASYASVASYAHRPSDTIAGVLLAGAVFTLAGTPGDGRLPPGGRVARLVLPIVGAVVLLLLSGVAGGEIHRSLLAGASLLGLLGAAVLVFLPGSR